MDLPSFVGSQLFVWTDAGDAGDTSYQVLVRVVVQDGA